MNPGVLDGLLRREKIPDREESDPGRDRLEGPEVHLGRGLQGLHRGEGGGYGAIGRDGRESARTGRPPGPAG